MKVIVFDLDDTLYDEKTYLQSSYRAVARYLAALPQIDESAAGIYRLMTVLYATGGRSQLFDRLLLQLKQRPTKTLICRCLSVYRRHQPEIHLPETSLQCLRRLNGYPLYIVTDGNKIVQHRKLKALGLYRMMKHCYITHRYGLRHAKPSPYCFLDLAAKEKAEPSAIVYIGDNPHKDFIGIKPLGFRTVRVLTGVYRHLQMDQAHEAAVTIASLAELEDALNQLK
ncbi:MAG: HAD family hydrolase [Sporolactobacillus sp.]|jgi:putative hydrolase of the HAD superfamily|nr:HAD family hydrolase [Sporolactobacillus sp.]